MPSYALASLFSAVAAIRFQCTAAFHFHLDERFFLILFFTVTCDFGAAVPLLPPATAAQSPLTYFDLPLSFPSCSPAVPFTLPFSTSAFLLRHRLTTGRFSASAFPGVAAPPASRRELLPFFSPSSRSRTVLPVAQRGRHSHLTPADSSATRRT